MSLSTTSETSASSKKSRQGKNSCVSSQAHYASEMDANGDDEEEKDLLNRLDSRKLEAIYNDYNLFAGDKGLKIQQFLAVMVQE